MRLLTVINIVAVCVNLYVLGITINSYEYVERLETQAENEILYCPTSNFNKVIVTPIEQEWIDEFAPLIKPRETPY